MAGMVFNYSKHAQGLINEIIKAMINEIIKAMKDAPLDAKDAPDGLYAAINNSCYDALGT